MSKLIFAAAISATAAIAMAAPSEAGSRWHDDHYSYGHGHKRIVVKYSQGYDYDDCYTKKVYKYNSWGKLVVKKVVVCE